MTKRAGWSCPEAWASPFQEAAAPNAGTKAKGPRHGVAPCWLTMLEREMGIEPTTICLEGRCSATELLPPDAPIVTAGALSAEGLSEPRDTLASQSAPR